MENGIHPSSKKGTLKRSSPEGARCSTGGGERKSSSQREYSIREAQVGSAKKLELPAWKGRAALAREKPILYFSYSEKGKCGSARSPGVSGGPTGREAVELEIEGRGGREAVRGKGNRTTFAAKKKATCKSEKKRFRKLSHILWGGRKPHRNRLSKHHKKRARQVSGHRANCQGEGKGLAVRRKTSSCTQKEKTYILGVKPRSDALYKI